MKAVLLLAALAATPDPAPPRFEDALLPEPLKNARWAALFDGGWSLLMTGAWIVSPCAQAGPACGFGLGGYSELSLRVDGHLELALAGGWIQGRVDHDDRRTLVESTWIEAPLMARAVHDLELGPVTLTGAAGAGVYFGLHAAHAHPARRGEPGTSALELDVIDGGIGVGLSARLRLSGGGFGLTADLDVAPLLGVARSSAPDVLSPVRTPGGLPVWRRLAVGLAFPPVGRAPVTLAARVMWAELSPRPLSAAGHWAAVLAFSVPFSVKNPDSGKEISDLDPHSRTAYAL